MAKQNSTGPGAELRAFIERYERLESEKKDIADQQKEVMAEAKGRGYETKILRQVIALRKRDKEDVAEEQAVLDLYLSALGMDFTPHGPDDADPSSAQEEDPSDLV